MPTTNFAKHDGTVVDQSGTSVNYPATQGIPTYAEIKNANALYE